MLLADLAATVENISIIRLGFPYWHKMLLWFSYNSSRIVLTEEKGDAIPSLSPCVKLSPVLYMTSVKCRMKTPPGAETSSTMPLGCWNKMSQ